MLSPLKNLKCTDDLKETIMKHEQSGNSRKVNKRYSIENRCATRKQAAVSLRFNRFKKIKIIHSDLTDLLQLLGNTLDPAKEE